MRYGGQVGIAVYRNGEEIGSYTSGNFRTWPTGDAEIIFGVVTDPNLSDTVKVTVIATGFEKMAHAPIPLGLHHQISSNQSSNGASANRAMRAAPARAEDLSSTLEGAPAAVPQTVGTRAFGASALHDEAVLDIPAYLRRGTSGGE